jgi:uncharacterized protein YjaG (DUF416 family)
MAEFLFNFPLPMLGILAWQNAQRNGGDALDKVGAIAGVQGNVDLHQGVAMLDDSEGLSELMHSQTAGKLGRQGKVGGTNLIVQPDVMF